jgi:hypothetical protein
MKVNVSTNVNTKSNSKKPYQGSNKIFYVYYGSRSKPEFSGTMEMCTNYMKYKSNLSLDHRSFRKEFK